MRPEARTTIAEDWTTVEFSIPATANAATLASLLLAASTVNQDDITGAASNMGLTANEASRVVSVIIMGEKSDGTTERGQCFYSESTAPTLKLPIEAGDEKEFPLTWRGLQKVFLSAAAQITLCMAEVYMTEQTTGDES